jgi:hypothetical protein
MPYMIAAASWSPAWQGVGSSGMTPGVLEKSLGPSSGVTDSQWLPPTNPQAVTICHHLPLIDPHAYDVLLQRVAGGNVVLIQTVSSVSRRRLTVHWFWQSQQLASHWRSPLLDRV